jgi:hypothetical protein
VQKSKSTHEPANWLFIGRRGIAIAVVAGIAWLMALSQGIYALHSDGLFGANGRGTIGLVSTKVDGRPGWERIDSVVPAGAAARANLAPGALIRFDQPFLAQADHDAGQTFGLVAAANGSPARHVTLTALPDRLAAQSDFRWFARISSTLAVWLSLVLGTLAIVRGWGSVTALALGMGMLAYSVDGILPSWVNQPALGVAFLVLSAGVHLGSIALLLLPAVLYIERLGSPGRGWTAAFCAIAVAALGLGLVMAWCALTDTAFAAIGDGSPAMIGLMLPCPFLALYWAWRGWREATGDDRTRFAGMLAISATMIVILLVNTAIPLPAAGHETGLALTLAFVPLVLSNLVLPLALAYLVLRHRVIDLGFALNRTVVYGTFSAILLGSFGLIEWGAEHLLPEQWVKASAWIDAGAAVMVYLAFHRVHDAIETRVEHLFFQGWQANEAILRRFVGSAPHFEDERALARSFADELSRFADEAPVALYRRRDRTHDSILERTAGSWDTAPRTLPVDDPAFALMRAERCPVDLTEALTDLPGVLALPMLDHGTLAGLVLMDMKQNGALYRPDEIAVLGWAAHHVALALAALHAGMIESENRLLKAQLARLGSLIGDRLQAADI